MVNRDARREYMIAFFSAGAVSAEVQTSVATWKTSAEVTSG
jgi:hypothetical protein